MSIIDDHLYSDMYSALVVFDISSITEPQLVEDFTVEDVFYYNPYITLDVVINTTEIGQYTRYEPIDNSLGIVTGWRTEVRQEPLEDQQLRYLMLESADVSTTATTDGANFGEVSTAGSMTRFLPIDRYLYTINFNELVLFSIAEDYRPSRFARLDTGTQAETLFQLNDLLFVGSTTGMLMYDVLVRVIQTISTVSIILEAVIPLWRIPIMRMSLYVVGRIVLPKLTNYKSLRLAILKTLRWSHAK